MTSAGRPSTTQTSTWPSPGRKIEGGYQMLEVRIPLAALGLSGEAGRELGFQLYVNDTDDPDAPYADTYHAVWYPRYGALNDPTAMHRLRLSGTSSPPKPAAAKSPAFTAQGVGIRVVGIEDLAGRPAGHRRWQRGMATGTFARVGNLARAELSHPGRHDGVGSATGHGDPNRRTTCRKPGSAGAASAPAGRNAALFGARIPRTMSLLANSHPDRREPVLFYLYGQSIVGAGFVVEDPRTATP